MRGKLALFLAVIAFTAAAVADEVRPARVRAPATSIVPTRAGVLACPIATIGRGRAYLHVANVDDVAASLRITLFPVKGKAVVISDTLAGQASKTIGLHGKVVGSSSALVEHSGGTVVVSHSLWVPPARGLPSGGAAGACLPSASTALALAPMRTLAAETDLTLFNPGAADAVVSIVLLTPERRAAPERLTRRIVPAHGRRDFSIGSFAFDARSVIALVEASSGQVVPEALVSSTQGMELIGAHTPSNDLVLTYGVAGPSSLSALGVSGDEDTGYTQQVLSPRGPSGDAKPSSILPGELRASSGPPREEAGAVVFRRTAGSPLVAGGSWRYRRTAGNDLAALEPLVPFTRWAATMWSGDAQSRTVGLIANPGETSAQVRVTVRGPSGETITTTEWKPGTVLPIGLAKGKGTVAVEVSADVPITFALVQIALSFGSAQYFDLPGFPLRPPLPVAARPDARAGVPARV